MRVMVLIKATEESEAGVMPSTELIEAMGRYNAELVSAGVMLSGEGLHPTSNAKRVVFDGESREVIDGPFGAINELVAGFWMWEVEDMDEAVEWLKKCPNPMLSRGEVEIRQVFEYQDFGDAMTEEQVEREERLREQIADR